MTALVRHDANAKRLYLHRVQAEKSLPASGISGAEINQHTESQTTEGIAIVPQAIHEGKAEWSVITARLYRLLTMKP